VAYLTGTLTRVDGAADTSGSTLNLTGSCTLNTAGIEWNNITITVAATITNNSLLTVTGTLTHPNANVVWAGSAGWIIGTMASAALTATRTRTYAAGNTYTVTTALTMGTSAAIRVTLVSGTPGSHYNFVLQAGASQDVGYVDATDADSSTGVTIFDFRGAAPSNCHNWTTTLDIPAVNKVAPTDTILGVTGTMDLPALNKVAPSDTLEGATGTMDIPAIASVDPLDTLEGATGTMDVPALNKVAPTDTLRGSAGTMDLPAVGNLRDTDTLEGAPGTLSSDKILKSNATGSGAGNYNDDNLAVGNVRPVAFGVGLTGDLSNLAAGDAAYVALENGRNNDNGTVAADIASGKSVKIRNSTTNGAATLETHTANQVLKSAGGNYDDDNLSAANVRPVAFGLAQTGDLSGLLATDAAYVAMENSRNNDNGTVAADIASGESVKIRNTTINGAATIETHTANQVLKSAGGNYDDDNLAVGNVRPVAFGLAQTGTLANLSAADAAYVAMENSRNNSNGTVAADIRSGKSVLIRNATTSGAAAIEAHTADQVISTAGGNYRVGNLSVGNVRPVSYGVGLIGTLANLSGSDYVYSLLEASRNDLLGTGVSKILVGNSVKSRNVTFDGTFDEAARNTDPGEANVKDGVEYLIRDGAYEGSYAPGGGGGGGTCIVGKCGPIIRAVTL